MSAIGVGLDRAGGGRRLPEDLLIRGAVAFFAREAVDESRVVERAAKVLGEDADIPRVRGSLGRATGEPKTHDARDHAGDLLCPSHAASPAQSGRLIRPAADVAPRARRSVARE
jgi:hypothetical protein